MIRHVTFGYLICWWALVVILNYILIKALKVSQNCPTSCTKSQTRLSVCPQWACKHEFQMTMPLFSHFANETLWKFLPLSAISLALFSSDPTEFSVTENTLCKSSASSTSNRIFMYHAKITAIVSCINCDQIDISLICASDLHWHLYGYTCISSGKLKLVLVAHVRHSEHLVWKFVQFFGQFSDAVKH